MNNRQNMIIQSQFNNHIILICAVLAVLFCCSCDNEAKKISTEKNRRETDEMLKNMDSNMVFVKGGCFHMGDVFGDSDKAHDFCKIPNHQHHNYEKPVHVVCLDDFSICKYEVTQLEWEKVMGNNPSFNKADRMPVELISYKDVQEFIEKLNRMSGKNYRLPTEAEWEYAARSGGKWERYAGANDETELPNYAWYGANAEKMLHLVGYKKPNGLGLHDMTGNAAEMVQDGWSTYEDTPQRNPMVAATTMEARNQCVIRGRGRVSERFPRPISMSMRDVGFRLARSAGQSTP